VRLETFAVLGRQVPLRDASTPACQDRLAVCGARKGETGAGKFTSGLAVYTGLSTGRFNGRTGNPR
jgi:hypothetical protein